MNIFPAEAISSGSSLSHESVIILALSSIGDISGIASYYKERDSHALFE